MPEVKTKIQNVVVSVTYKDTKFNLERLMRCLEGARYDPKIFPGIAYKSEEPPASFLIFSSGKMNCVGAKSLKDAKLAIYNLTRKLRKFGIKIGSEPEIKIQNIVASVDFCSEFNLEEISRDFETTEYEPEVFPGLVFRLDDPRVVVLLFVSGKGVCAGAKSKKDVDRAAKKIVKMLKHS